ncbi:MAG: hypothetical protein ABSA65_14965 [Acidimicrobiales bacterium]|jgi:hypothetical protein
MSPILRLGGFGLALMLVSVVSQVTDAGVGASQQPAASGVARTSSGTRGQTVYDPLLNVTWLADSNLASKETFNVRGINRDGSMDYQTAVTWVKAMDAYDHGRGYLGHDNWMLPATTPNDPSCSSYKKEGGGSFGYGCLNSGMGSLYYKTLRLHEPDTAVPISKGKPSPFNDFQPYLYWTGGTAAKRNTGFVTFSFNTGWQGSNVYQHNIYVLPMIEGNPFHTPVGNGKKLRTGTNRETVYDPLADVTWLADADLAKTEKFGVADIDRDGSMEHQTALAWIAAMNKADWLGSRQWQLPPPGSRCSGFDCEAGPLGELYYDGLGLSQGDPVVATPDTTLRGFYDVQPYLYWSCAAKRVQGPCQGAPAPGFAWSFSFGNGFQGTDLDQNNLYVMVYYPAPPIALPVASVHQRPCVSLRRATERNLVVRPVVVVGAGAPSRVSCLLDLSHSAPRLPL